MNRIGKTRRLYEYSAHRDWEQKEVAYFQIVAQMSEK